MPTIKRSVSFNQRIKSEIDDYAKSQRIAFSSAVNELCDRALHQQFDAQYAPNIARLVDKALDQAVKELEETIEIECDRCSYKTVEEIREMMQDLEQDI